jgi:hypothetical protein
MEGGVAIAPPPPPQSWTVVHVDGPCPRVVEGGPRGRGRARLATLAKSVAVITTVAAIASTILDIAVAVTTMSITLATIARGMRQSRGRWGRGIVGVEHL